MTSAALFPTLLAQSPAVAIASALLAALCVLVIVWAVLSAAARHKPGDIDKQIASLKRHADKAVKTRPRVRAGRAGSHPNRTTHL